MPQSVQILGTGQLLTLAGRLRAAGGARLRANMARRVRRAAEPLQRDLQEAIRSVDLPGSGRRVRGGPSPTERPLRATLAGGIRISVRTTSPPGARVWMDKSRLPADLRNMPWVIENGRVRHPVFGNRRRWATQWARPAGWWSRTVQAGMPRMRAEVARVLDDVRRDLE
ncbi:hypothetical protein [Streptomyces odontomachi]|uniref:hypothetical protein n=1 Tax=Streptomyces odontomachi TaxID=2944940 RepID=UPI00210A1149|nr:hypothetical protein [Streptomyces sp. ODS25]